MIPTPEPLTGSWAIAEEIAARDLNNLYLTSCWFADRERYRAFCAFYAVMRVVDDRIDEIPSRHELTDGDKAREHAVVDAWQRALEASAGSGPTPEMVLACDHPRAAELLEVAGRSLGRFPHPRSLWRNFFDAMHQDIERPRFATFDEFLAYTEGASVAPTTIYLHLIAAEAGADGIYRSPEGFELVTCGHHLGTFAYLGHIVRDLADDLATGDEGLLYLAADDLASHGLDEAILRSDLRHRRAGAPLRRLVGTLLERSQAHHGRGRELLAPLEGRLSADRAFVLELIVTLYERVLEKIAANDHDPMGGQHRLTLEEKQSIAFEVAAKTGFDLG